MSFQYKIFPELRLKHGVEKALLDPVSITSNGNREIRRKINTSVRSSWTIPARNLHQAEIQSIIDFADEVGVNSFLYRDPTLPELVNQPLIPFFTSSAGYYFALYHSGRHPILNLSNPQLGQLETWEIGNALSPDVVFKRNGVVMDFSVGLYGAHMNYNPAIDGSSLPRTTVINKLDAPFFTNGDIITYSGPIYHTVRFDSTLSFKITAMQKSGLISGGCEVVPVVSELADIKLMEVFEYEDTN